eukprot:TRINITY_DN8885_c0_g1_i1.p1 TRINITY_DN8885_c0_g1~~TRINITY_DN8885_c0_g1_i1.p1  ORF type:complete len:712 (+),score=171.84 TRINITY_DN8885_c0_g1_i1:132-2267(+)
MARHKGTDYQVGDYVYTSEWRDGELSSSQQLFHVAHIVQINVSATPITVELQYLYRPHQTFHKATHAFHENEVLSSSDKHRVPIDHLHGRCAVLNRTNYRDYNIVGVDDKDTYVCLSRYADKRKQISAVKNGHRPVVKPKLKRRQQPRELVRVKEMAYAAAVAEESVHQGLDADNATMLGDIPIQIVRDADIPVHIHNITEEMPPLLYPNHANRPEARLRFQRFQAKNSLIKNVLTADAQTDKRHDKVDHDDTDDLNGDNARVAQMLLHDQSSEMTAAQRVREQLTTKMARVTKTPRMRLKGQNGTSAKRSKSTVQDDIDDDDYDDNDTMSHAEPARKPANKHARVLLDEEDDDVAVGQDGGDEREDADHYFEQQTSRAAKTSDNTLAELELLKLNEGSVQAVLRKLQDRFEPQRQQLMTTYSTQYDNWHSKLLTGFNLLFFGLGSKKKLLMNFASAKLRAAPVLCINGYFPSLSIKQILNSICERHMGYKGNFRHVLEQAEFIRSMYQHGDTNAKPLYLIIHNIDGPMLRNDVAQTALSTLASARGIRLVASGDHINASLLWDQGRLSRYNFVWIEAATYAHYTAETAYTDTVLMRKTVITVAAALIVMKSLTHNGRKAYWTLLKHQIENAETPNYQGVRFPEYLGMCQQNFAAHDEARLRSYMTEYKDHQLLRVKKSDGIEYLHVPVAAELLQQLVDMMQQNFPDDHPE